jgi:hypothetical protein
MKVHDTVIVEILAWEDFVLNTAWMDVGERVGMSVPSPEACIEASNESDLVVNDDEFLVVCLRE